MIIMKFGGTSTKDAPSMQNVTNIIKSNIGNNPVVVISAIAQATNQLENMGELAKCGKIHEAEFLLKDFINRHNAIIISSVKNPSYILELNSKLESTHKEIMELIKGVAILGELTPRTLDRFYSYGELLSSSLISFIMKENGIDTVWLDTKDFLITDDNYNRALPIINLIEEKLKRIISENDCKGKTIVTQGFIGATLAGDRTTMGRESSDYSAAIIGAALDTSNIQIWTDVDGVLTGDPNIVQSPKKIKVLTFEEAYQLSLLGAKVLHPNTMLPAQEKNIPIYIYNSKRPEVTGTLVTSDIKSSINEKVVKSITYKTKISFLTVKPQKRYSPFIFWEHIFSVLNKHKIIPLITATAEYQFSVIFESKFKNDSVLHEIEKIGYINIQDNLAVVSIIGNKINQDYSIVNKVISKLNSLNINFLSFGASELSTSFLLPESEVEDTVSLLHDMFFQNVNNVEIFEPINENVF